jgi:hypothetical protein
LFLLVQEEEFLVEELTAEEKVVSLCFELILLPVLKQILLLSVQEILKPAQLAWSGQIPAHQVEVFQVWIPVEVFPVAVHQL